jgi:hypothetical protein
MGGSSEYRQSSLIHFDGAFAVAERLVTVTDLVEDLSLPTPVFELKRQR